MPRRRCRICDNEPQLIGVVGLRINSFFETYYELEWSIRTPSGRVERRRHWYPLEILGRYSNEIAAFTNYLALYGGNISNVSHELPNLIAEHYRLNYRLNIRVGVEFSTYPSNVSRHEYESSVDYITHNYILTLTHFPPAWTVVNFRGIHFPQNGNSCIVRFYVHPRSAR